MGECGPASSSRRRQRRGWPALVAALLAFGALMLGATTAAADDLAGTDPEGARELAEKYAPIMMLKAQAGPCDEDGEPYGPMSVEGLLDNPEILLRQLGTGNPVMGAGPEPSELFGLGEGFFLDFPGDALRPGCIYERDYRKYTRDQPAVVYAHVVRQDDRPDRLALQYWFYWYYNDWNNKHESDWEGIQLLFPATTIAEALAGEPTSVGYAQHEGGERADWDAPKLERNGNRPVVYSSAGSHASYFGSALYLGRSGDEGFGCDNTDGPSNRVEPEVVVLPDFVDDAADPLAWLAFNGRWGERQGGPFNGPTGPTAKGRWLEPVDWHDELRPTSVVIPAGDSLGNTVITGFCGVVEWGSGTLISITTSPARVLVALVVLLFAVSWLARRTDWGSVAALPLRRRRRVGQIIRLAATAHAIAPRSLFTFGLAYLPAAALGAVIAALIAITPVISDILDLTTGATGIDLFMSLIAGGIPHVLALAFVNAAVAIYLDRAGGQDPVSAFDATKLAWDRRRSLAMGLLQGAAVVGLLLFTVVGTPWAIRQVIRYQFMPHAAVLEDLDGRAALARSAALTRGRWWHTALFLSILNALVFGGAFGIGIILLVMFSQIPLVLFSLLISLLLALISPVLAVALTFLYGDAIAERSGMGSAEPVSTGVAIEGLPA